MRLRLPALLLLAAAPLLMPRPGAAQAQQSAEPATRAAQAEAAALPAINVNAQREENVGYQGVRTTVGKSPQLLRDVPQSVTVVTEQLIQDLTREANQARQALITQEISEIVGGAAALAEAAQD